MAFEAILNKKKKSDGSARTCSLRTTREPKEVERFDNVMNVAEEKFKTAGYDIKLSNNDILIVMLSFVDANKKYFAEHIANSLKK